MAERTGTSSARANGAPLQADATGDCAVWALLKLTLAPAEEKRFAALMKDKGLRRRADAGRLVFNAGLKALGY